jgi:hypothetical protein
MAIVIIESSTYTFFILFNLLLRAIAKRGIYESHPIFSQVQLTIIMKPKTFSLISKPQASWLGPHLLYGKIFIFHLQEYTFTHTTYNNKIVLKTKL